MAFELKADESVAAGIRRIALGQIDNALEGLKERTDETTEKVVHDARKRFKKVRAALRLVRASLGRKVFDRENARFRDAGRPLSEVRDAAVLVKTIDSLAEHFGDRASTEAVGSIREALRNRERATRRRMLDREDAPSSLIAHIEAARRDVKGWEIDGDGWPALADGLKWIYKRGFQARQAASDEATIETLHEWRKRVKDLWHALEVLRPIRPRFLEDLANRAHDLADRLGDDHDLAVLRDLLADPAREIADRAAAEALIPLIDLRRTELQRDAFELAKRVYRDRPKPFVARLAAYWRAWRAEAEVARFEE